MGGSLKRSKLQYDVLETDGGNLDFGQANLVTDGNRFSYTPTTDEVGIQLREIFDEANALDWVNRQWNADIDLLQIMKSEPDALKKKQLKKEIVEEQGYRDIYIDVDEAGSVGGTQINDDKESEYYGAGFGVINRYYSKKGAQYIQLKHYGLFRLGAADPLGDALKRRKKLTNGIPQLQNIQSKIRARIKGSGSRQPISKSKGERLGLPLLPESHPDYSIKYPYGKEVRVNPYNFTMALKASGYSISNVDLTGPTKRSGDNQYGNTAGSYDELIKVLRTQPS